eukprot:9786907-Alexandrium_andersonii.AAC.1
MRLAKSGPPSTGRPRVCPRAARSDTGLTSSESASPFGERARRCGLRARGARGAGASPKSQATCWMPAEPALGPSSK